jgi:hypothetical protein
MKRALPCPRVLDYLLLALLAGLALPCQGEDASDERNIADVNEGALTFLTQPPDKPMHHHRNHLRVDRASLAEGWVELRQCHENLDAVPALQIVFRDGYARDLHVTETVNVGEARVDGTSVQLRDIERGARLCLSAQTRALRQVDTGLFALSSGPYMRKFLDGYYPMRVSMRVEYDPTLVRVLDVSPEQQPGFAIRYEAGALGFDAVFEGELRTAILFELIPPPR